MKLNKMTATFGKLDNATLELGEGLTIITAPNEGGKSTWTGFLRTMLYGIDTKDRDKKGYLADKNRFQPWSGKPMTGELSLHWGGRDITLRRGPKGATPFGAFSATYTGTEAPVPGLTSTDCGFALTGVERQVYERSAFLAAGSHAVTATPELERRIAALVTTGEEDISFSQVEEKLKEWGRIRRVNRSVGLIPKLEEEVRQLGATLDGLAQLNGQIATATAEKLSLTARLAELDDALHQHQLAERQLQNQKFHQAQQGQEEAQRQLDALLQDVARYDQLPTQERLRHWQGELAVLHSLTKELKGLDTPLEEATATLEETQHQSQHPVLSPLSATDAIGLGQRETANYRSADDALTKLRHRPLLCTLLILVGAGILIGATVHFDLPPYVPGGGGALLGSLWMAGLIALHSKKKRLKSQMATILERYHISEIEQLLPLVEDYSTRQLAMGEAETALRALQQQTKGLGERADSLQTRILEFVHTFSPQVQGLVGCSAAISRGLKLEEDLTLARANLAGATRLVQAMGEGATLTAQPPSYLPNQSPVHLAAQRGAAQEELRRVEGHLAQLLGRQQASGDPAALSAQREALEEELTRRQEELTAIEVALDALRAANVRLQERFSPQLNAKAGEYLSLLTQGKYGTVALTRELEGSVTQGDDPLPHSALSLSRGTADQLYLAVRLAVCHLCLPADEPVPLVLDDALTAFDQPRMERALDLLCQLAENRQILLFSCHSREADYLATRAGVTCITL